MPLLTKDQVFEALMRLGDAERAEILERLASEGARLSPEQEGELREALCEHRENPGEARSWSDIKAELLAKSSIVQQPVGQSALAE